MSHHHFHSPSDPAPTPSTPRHSNTFPVFSFTSSPATGILPSPHARTHGTHTRTSPGRRTASLFSFRNLGTTLPGISISHASGRKADDKDKEHDHDRDRGRGRGRGRGRSGTRSAETVPVPLVLAHGDNQPTAPAEVGDCGYAPRPEGTQSTPTLLFPSCTLAGEEDAGEDADAGGEDVTAAQVRTATAIRIPFLDEDEVSRLHPPAREVRVQHRHRGHQRNRQHQLSSSSSTSRAWTASAEGASVSSPGAGDGNDAARGGELFDVDTAVRVSMISLGLGRLENTNDHPGPLCSNPPRDAASFTTDVEMKFDEISLGTRRSRPLSQVYDLNLDLASASPCPSPAYQFPDDQEMHSVSAPRSPIFFPSSANDEEADLAHLQTTLAALLAANTALMTLKAAHEQTIAYHESTISAHKDSIAELSRQLRDRDEEQAGLAKSACKEVESLNEENAALREERWNLMGRVAELEQTTARMEALLRLGGQMGGDDAGKDDWPLRGESSSTSDSGSNLQCFSSPVAQGPWTGNGGVGSPDTLPSSMPSPDSCRRNSMQGFYASSPTPGGRSAYSAIHRRQRVPPQMIGAEDGVVCSVEQTKLERAQVALREGAAVEERNVRPQANAVSEDALIQGITSISVVPSSVSAPLPIPELPVLTYTKSGAVWLDRITNIFKYLGLLGFLQGDDHSPDASTPSAAADWAARRLRAAILIKHAVDDAILEDVLYLHRRRDNRGTPASGNNVFRPSPATEDPRRLLRTILTLSRAVPISATDLSWIDRIDGSDFDGADGFEGFASLVLCVDRRHSLMYGTSPDHYEMLLPRIQECMSRLFPGLDAMALFGDPESVIPRKRWQLTVWMAKVVKRRRIGDY